MKIVALMPVRNEEWILRVSAEVALRWCDAIVILDHASTDRTWHIMDELQTRHPGRVTMLHRRDPTWNEMQHRQALLEAGRAAGGTHFALIDADEILTSNALDLVRPALAELNTGECLDVPMLPVWGDLEHVRVDDCVWTRSWLTLAFADAPHLSWRPQTDGYQHHHRAPFRSIQPSHRAESWLPRHGPGTGGAGVMHLQFANHARLRAKHALYKMQEVIRWPERERVEIVDEIYSVALDESGMRRFPCPGAWWDGYDKEAINLEGVPWQRTECVRLASEHGAKRFAGLQLWGEADA